MRYARFLTNTRFYTVPTKGIKEKQTLQILDSSYICDDFTNATPKIISYTPRKLHNCQINPLCLVKQKIIHYFNTNFKAKNGNSLFPIFDDLNPVVTVHQNFDSLLIPENHVSRKQSECFYINRSELLRAHMTAHQSELITMGLDHFIAFGDVYRRDQIDSTHFPVFHQSDAARLFNKMQLENLSEQEIPIFENNKSEDTPDKQGEHTIDATKIVEGQLKSTLVGLIKALFGSKIDYRWVDVYFPFTHPSWELEILSDDTWIEVLGCGIIRNNILQRAGAGERIGWAFGLGLERLAMFLYGIPDIRLFWSTDSGFLHQFKNKTIQDVIKYEPISVYPQCSNDLSFWIPDKDNFGENYFFELVRDVGGDIIEQVYLIDDFIHPKTQKRSLCYRIVYRHLERTLTQEEVNEIHKLIENKATQCFGITVR